MNELEIARQIADRRAAGYRYEALLRAVKSQISIEVDSKEFMELKEKFDAAGHKGRR